MRIISFLIFGACVAVNYLIGLQTGSVSDKYSLYVTPPSMFFHFKFGEKICVNFFFDRPKEFLDRLQFTSMNYYQ